MRDDQDLFEILADQVDGFNQALAPLDILVAKPLIDHQRLQLCACPFCQHARKSQANGKINPESFAPTEGFIIPHSPASTNADVECFALVNTLCILKFTLCWKTDAHGVVREPTEDVVGLLFQFGDRLLNQHRRHPVFTKGFLDQFKVANGTADAFGVLPDGNEVLFLLFDRSKLLSYPAKAHLHPGDR